MASVTRTLAILFGFALALLHGKAFAQDVSLVSVAESSDVSADECTCGDGSPDPSSRDWFDAASFEFAGQMSEYAFEQIAQTFPLRPLWCFGTNAAQCSEDRPADRQAPSTSLVVLLVADVSQDSHSFIWLESNRLPFVRTKDSVGPSGVPSSLDRPPNA